MTTVEVQGHGPGQVRTSIDQELNLWSRVNVPETRAGKEARRGNRRLANTTIFCIYMGHDRG
ncbi:hypothetical protein Dda_8290 [Drechslerella dactyloides]|uniref:Uncharacterized protein n=1 Tax=Drechslerella dactyloides TaxID=74499 RepID=A0AAD6IV66_DREDA|nr:hypothetical protein Dda_8290 [Drechslerella dactyloides]